MDFSSEIDDLKRRVGDLEGAVNVLTGQLGKVHPEIVMLTEATASRFDQIASLVGRAVTRLDTMNTQVWSLRDDLPRLVAAAIREGGGDN